MSCQTLLEILMNMMLDVAEVPDELWNNQEDNEEEGSLFSATAQVSLDRVCIAMGGDEVGPILFHHIPTMISNPGKQKSQMRLTGDRMEVQICRAHDALYDCGRMFFRACTRVTERVSACTFALMAVLVGFYDTPSFRR